MEYITNIARWFNRSMSTGCLVSPSASILTFQKSSKLQMYSSVQSGYLLLLNFSAEWLYSALSGLLLPRKNRSNEGTS